MTRRTERRVYLALAALCWAGATAIGGWRLVVLIGVALAILAGAVQVIADVVQWWERRSDPDGVRAAVRAKRRERAS